MKSTNFLIIAVITLALSVLVTSCGTSQTRIDENKVTPGKTVVFDYATGLDNGTLIDTSFQDVAVKAAIYDPNRDYRPEIIVYGNASLIPGVEEALFGMKEGEIKNIRIPPKEAYGEYIENSTIVVPLKDFQGDGLYEKGMMIPVVTPNGNVAAYLIEITEDEKIVLDLNHPYAGEHLQFSIIVKEIYD
jgi:peptidylprolyl isomerase